jgi:2-polyprenyl-6-methoxyphenol hydroxylase-like FAD-dependent oxidoreductase
VADLPVLVAGGGPVGLASALLLARYGVPVVVLEALPQRETVGSKSICVQRDVLDIYHRMGCAAAFLAEGVTWHRGRTFYRDHELFTITFPDAGRSAYPGFVNIGQSSVEQVLESMCGRSALVDVRYGCAVTDVWQDESSVTVRAGGRSFTGSHLIAADGARSAVRGLLGLDFPGMSFDDRFLIVDIRADMPFGAERRFHFDPPWNPGRQVLLHPQPGSVWRIDWQVPAEYDSAADDLDARIRQVVGTVPYEVLWRSVYRFHQRLASRLRVGRVLLAGDAAHLMSPFGARGLNSGIQDAENAAWKIAYERRGWAGPALLDSYEVERTAAAEENLRVTAETMRFLVPQSAADWAWRHSVLDRAVSDPAARALVNSGKLAEPYWYVGSPLTTGGVLSGFPTAPGATRPPVAGVLCPDGPVAGPAAGGATRLRELFGFDMTVLAMGFDPPSGLPVYRLDQIDSDGVLVPALGATPGWCAVVRPDGHLAAVLDSPSVDELDAALARARGFS